MEKPLYELIKESYNQSLTLLQEMQQEGERLMNEEDPNEHEAGK